MKYKSNYVAATDLIFTDEVMYSPKGFLIREPVYLSDGSYF